MDKCEKLYAMELTSAGISLLLALAYTLFNLPIAIAVLAGLMFIACIVCELAYDYKREQIEKENKKHVMKIAKSVLEDLEIEETDVENVMVVVITRKEEA